MVQKNGFGAISIHSTGFVGTCGKDVKGVGFITMSGHYVQTLITKTKNCLKNIKSTGFIDNSCQNV